MQTDFQENVNAKSRFSIAALHNSLVLRSLMSLNVLISSAAETKKRKSLSSVHLFLLFIGHVLP